MSRHDRAQRKVRSRSHEYSAVEEVWWLALGAATLAGAIGPDAEDVAQTTALRFLLSTASISNTAAWARTVARRRVLRIQQRQRRHEPLEDREIPASRSDEVAWGSWQELLAALRRLGRRDRHLLTAYARGHTYEELSAIVGIPQAQVGVYLQRARRRIRAIRESVRSQVAGTAATNPASR